LLPAITGKKTSRADCAATNYRDLGIADATNGMVRAHVIRFIPPCRPEEVSKRHYHDVDFQMIYVLKGWIKTELDGQGAIVMRAGSAWIQPPRIEHVVLDYSDDCEVLEIILPADFATVELEEPPVLSRRKAAAELAATSRR
jgi:Cupin domain